MNLQMQSASSLDPTLQADLGQLQNFNHHYHCFMQYQLLSLFGLHLADQLFLAPPLPVLFAQQQALLGYSWYIAGSLARQH